MGAQRASEEQPLQESMGGLSVSVKDLLSCVTAMTPPENTKESTNIAQGGVLVQCQNRRIYSQVCSHSRIPNVVARKSKRRPWFSKEVRHRSHQCQTDLARM